MSPNSWKKVGKIKDAHGLRGDLAIIIFSKDISWIKQLKTFGLSSLDQESPKIFFEVQKIKEFKMGIMLKANGIEDRTQAEKVKGNLFYIPEELLQSEEGDQIFLSEILYFVVIDQNQIVIGPVVSFSSNTIQDLLVVEMNDGKKVEIPFVDAFIEKINFEEKKILMNLPEGLLDL